MPKSIVCAWLIALAAATACGEEDDGGCVAFGGDCTPGQDTCCAAGGVAGECYAFGKGPQCTIPCPADPAQCPNNGAGCNMMSPAYCKPSP